MGRTQLIGLCLRALAAACVFALSSVALAATTVPPALRAAIILRAAGYERGFADRSGEAVIAVVHSKSGPSADDGNAMAEVFTKLLKETKVAGRKGRIVHVVHESVANTVEQLKSQRAEVVYFANGLEGTMASVPAREGGVSRILVCATGAGTAAGCTLGVELDGDRPRIVLNMKEANAAGLRFDPGLLRLARIVR
jgi:ABC-type branched-subunit amino acid transport system substrate-binding protein